MTVLCHPGRHKPESAIVRARLAFPGPIFGRKDYPNMFDAEDHDPLIVRGAGELEPGQ